VNLIELLFKWDYTFGLWVIASVVQSTLLISIVLLWLFGLAKVVLSWYLIFIVVVFLCGQGETMVYSKLGSSIVLVSFLAKSGPSEPTWKLVLWMRPLIFPVNSLFLSISAARWSLSAWVISLGALASWERFFAEPIKQCYLRNWVSVTYRSRSSSWYDYLWPSFLLCH
jgi:hypothetical protein